MKDETDTVRKMKRKDAENIMRDETDILRKQKDLTEIGIDGGRLSMRDIAVDGMKNENFIEKEDG